MKKQPAGYKELENTCQEFEQQLKASKAHAENLAAALALQQKRYKDMRERFITEHFKATSLATHLSLLIGSTSSLSSQKLEAWAKENGL